LKHTLMCVFYSGKGWIAVIPFCAQRALAECVPGGMYLQYILTAAIQFQLWRWCSLFLTMQRQTDWHMPAHPYDHPRSSWEPGVCRQPGIL
jgi:hypothetical protein